ncbi:MAG: murein biosynthesis integral membrane protein MurJ [Alphaproteobacteria bacterium]|nr:murein biosynthesis integral membrane protein MurJ [Alphaproteobacteria bacterium]
MAAPLSVIKSILTVGGWTMVSRVLGFVRDLLIANFLGAGMIADAFFVAFKLPNLFRSLFAEGAFNVAFVPLFSEQLETKGKESARLFAEEAFSALFYIVLLFSAIAEIAMPLFIIVQAPGFIEDTAKFDAAVIMARITFPYLLLVSLNSLQSGMLNSMGYFAAAALTPVLLNLTMIASLFALTPLFGGNYGYALSAGVTLAGVFQLLWLIWHTHRAGLPLGLQKPAAFFKHKSQELKLLMKRIIPGVLGSGIYQINLFLDTLFVSFLSTGAISWLYYANRLYQLPVGIIGAAIGTALLPILSRQLKAGETEQAQNSLNRALEFALLMSVPSMAGLMALSYPVISVLFERGEFTNTDSVNTAVALCAYAAGLPAYILTKTLAPVFYARGDTTTPVRIAAWALGLYILLCAAFLPKFGYVGIALATGIVAWINVLQYICRIKKQDLHHTDRTFKKRSASILFSSVLMTIAVIFANKQAVVYFPDWIHGTQIMRFGILTALIAFGGIIFIISVLLSGGVNLKELKNRLHRKKG